ncbi:hypothetical protein GCM10010435_83310 [Winogradskya consettensis]|uniref:Geranylgeranyl transferase type II subunit beta n=2 Tax=Winogradskya consettensis TaxID=113560 RepID=A0A919W654_9ACTN|nr:hypothetical protein Aco04nite_80790 [Actinoplanes consettensis]
MTLFTTDGGARVPEADLWCSYAAVRGLHWLGAVPADPDAVATFMASRQNADGGFAWQRGLPSDIWATYYCTQTLRDLGRPVPHRDALTAWLPELRSDGGFGMSPGRPADVWATYYAARTSTEILGLPVPDLPGLGRWLASCQHDGAGVGWQPGSDQPDVRAGYYAANAWRAVAGDAPVPLHRDGAVRWLRDRQGPDGGMGFTPGAESCTWAAFRAVRALNALGATVAGPDALRRWLAARRLPGGGYERWDGYGSADVWSCFTVAGTLEVLDGCVGDDPATVELVRGFQQPGSGFTYRDPGAAGDSLATAAALLSLPAGDARAGSLVGWLRAAQLPYEDGVMYMPGRGAEIRCTLWAAAALAAHDRHLDLSRLRRWLRTLQNVDGGFGYWHGRGSDLTSTVSALELAETAGIDAATTIDLAALRRFVDAERARQPVTLTGTAQIARALALLGATTQAAGLAATMSGWAGPLGGYSATPRGIPDLLSTYQGVLTTQVCGAFTDLAALRRLLRKLRTGDGYAWSPLSRDPAGPLANCLGALLTATADGRLPVLPRLNL